MFIKLAQADPRRSREELRGRVSDEPGSRISLNLEVGNRGLFSTAAA